MMSKFYFNTGPSSTTSNSDSDADDLPYPLALPRSDFLTPDFSAPDYLSTLSSRHQTLEDLRSDLRERSQALSKELLDLVNTNYEQFLSLGSDLRGGEERVEGVIVGLLGFKRGVEAVRERVKERRREVEGLLKEKRDVGKRIMVGRWLLELEDRLEELEDRLLVSSLGEAVDDEWSDSEDEEDGSTGSRKLGDLVTDWRKVEVLRDRIGEHPYVTAQEARMVRVKNTILLDLGTALKQASGQGAKDRLMTLLGMYRDLGAGEDAVRILRNSRGHK